MAEPARRRRQRRGSVRLRATLGAVVLVGLVLLGASVTFGALLRRSLVNGVRTTVEVLAADVAADLEAGGDPERIPELDDEDQALVQVVGGDGEVVASSDEIESAGRIPLALPTGAREVVRIIERPVLDDDEDFVVIARRAETDGERPLVVYVASTLEEVDETMASAIRGLVIGVPLVLVAIGLTTWLVVGRALRPVEVMRAEVAEISGSALDRRVAEPPVDDEVGRLARTMNAMLDRLQAAHERQRRFVADASHELRSPLASTRAQLEVGLSSGDTDWSSTVGGVLDEQHRMERLVEELLFMARVAEGAGAARRVPVDLDDVVLAEVAKLRARSAVQVDIAGVSAGRVDGDPDHLGQVVRNLLDNAERHARSRIWVELRTQGPTVGLVVADDGEGIDREDRERVFERFTRLDAARARQDGGAGLGLAIAREVVEAHSGRIEVLDSATGTRIAVTLPSATIAAI